MQSLYDIPAPAKLNLFLHITGRRSDGYHLLQSVFMLIDWCDTLHFDLRTDGQISREDLTWALPAEDLVVRHGLLFRQVPVVPYGRMQFIDVSAGPVDRFFGLATVQLHTAAAASDARIPGLAQSEADRLRDRLATLGQAQATGL